MKKDSYYSSGELMKLAHISKKTVRYYDEHNILKPSFVDTETRARFYTDEDLAKLQQILLFKAMGFSLDDIREITINSGDFHFMSESLSLQQKLIDDRIEQLQVVSQAIKETKQLINAEKAVDWSNMLDLIHNLGMETSMKNQYQNASNISSRINLHSLYSKNKTGWFPWIFSESKFTANNSVLELGCGDGSFWTENLQKMPSNMWIYLTDVSEGMLRDTRRRLNSKYPNFNFCTCSAEALPFDDASFDIVIANHVLFYCDDIKKACAEISRVLKPGGKLICSAYGTSHMKEISKLVSDFDNRIVLSADKLYEKFGKENGSSMLSPFFSSVIWKQYEDELNVTEADSLISYILSCHGNQNQFILDRYSEFRSFVKKAVGKSFYVTKDAGIFICEK